MAHAPPDLTEGAASFVVIACQALHYCRRDDSAAVVLQRFAHRIRMGPSRYRRSQASILTFWFTSQAVDTSH